MWLFIWISIRLKLRCKGWKSLIFMHLIIWTTPALKCRCSSSVVTSLVDASSTVVSCLSVFSVLLISVAVSTWVFSETDSAFWVVSEFTGVDWSLFAVSTSVDCSIFEAWTSVVDSGAVSLVNSASIEFWVLALFSIWVVFTSLLSLINFGTD